MHAGNGGSMEKCRRRWDLADADHLKYRFMQVQLAGSGQGALQAAGSAPGSLSMDGGAAAELAVL